jgi:mannose-6-phosphate isomerase-like protein (cupin superfamily)
MNLRGEDYQRSTQAGFQIIMAIEPTQTVGTKLMFENERIRVWDLSLQPGQSLEKHVHHEDYVFIVLEGGSLVHVDDEDASKDVAVNYETDQVVWLEAGAGLVHNKLVNVGDKPYRNLVIELKSIT